MGYIKEKGLVIKEINTGESDKIITVLLGSYGKITGYVKGARRHKSHCLAGSQFLCYSDFVLYKGKSMYQVYGCDIVESFYSLRNDLEKLTYSAHMADIVYDVIQENQPASKTLQLFLNSLYMLANSKKSPELITRIFELRLLAILGYSPHMKNCQICASFDIENMFFSYDNCGILCDKCSALDKSAVKMSSGSILAIKHIISSNMKNLFNFNISESVNNELSNFSKRYLKERLGGNYAKLEFLENI